MLVLLSLFPLHTDLGYSNRQFISHASAKVSSRSRCEAFPRGFGSGHSVQNLATATAMAALQMWIPCELFTQICGDP